MELTKIANDSAMLFATSASWSPEDGQLVAALVPYTSPELFKAIKASLSTNSNRQWVSVRPPMGETAVVKSAKRGFTTIGNTFSDANAKGLVTAMLHPLTGNPQEQTETFFYLVVTPGEVQAQKFVERLNLAVPWPVQPEWADYLFNTGIQQGLIEPLPSSGDDFEAILRIVKDEDTWRQIIEEGLRSQQISI